MISERPYIVPVTFCFCGSLAKPCYERYIPHAESPACRGLQAHLPRLALTTATQLLDRHGPDRGGGPDGICLSRCGLPAGCSPGISPNHRPQQYHAAAGTMAARTASGHGRPASVAGPAALPALRHNTPQNGHAGPADLATKSL